MAIGRKPKYKCEAEACTDFGRHRAKIGERVVHLCDRHAAREKNDPGTVELKND